ITDFDKGNSGTFDPTEGDQIELGGLFAQPVSIAQVGANTVADFGNGDVLTFLNMNAADVQRISGVVQVPPGAVSYSGPATLSSPQFYTVTGASISNVSLTAGVNSVVLDTDAASTINTTAPGTAGIFISSGNGGDVDVVNNASVTTSAASSIGINVSNKNGAG